MGASAADFREAWVSLGTLSSTLQTNGFYASVDATIKSQATAVLNLNPSSMDPYAMLAKVRKFVPAIQLPAIESAINQVNSSSKQSLIANGTLPAVKQYMSALQACEATVGRGVATVKFGIRRQDGPSLRQVSFCGAALTGSLLALAAIFAPEVTVGVLFGTVIYGSDFLLMGAGMYGAIGAITC